MRTIIRILFLLLLLVGLGVLGAQVASVRAVHGEYGKANLWNAVSIVAQDEMLRPLIVTSVAAAVVGLVGLLLTSFARRPHATPAEEAEAEPEGSAEG
jgi:hypothetical protein